MHNVPNFDLGCRDDLRGRIAEYAAMTPEEKEAALPDLRAYLDRNPGVWETFGDVGRRAKEALAKAAGQDNLLITESVLKRIAREEDELAPPGSPPILRLAAREVILGKLAAEEADVRSLAEDAKEAPGRAEYLDRRRDRAHRRHQAAMTRFATLCAKLRPAPHPIDVARHLANPGTDSSSANPRATSSPQNGQPVVN